MISPYINLTMDDDFIGNGRIIQFGATSAPLIVNSWTVPNSTSQHIYGRVAAGVVAPVSNNVALTANVSQNLCASGRQRFLRQWRPEDLVLGLSQKLRRHCGSDVPIHFYAASPEAKKAPEVLLGTCLPRGSRRASTPQTSASECTRAPALSGAFQANGGNEQYCCDGFAGGPIVRRSSSPSNDGRNGRYAYDCIDWQIITSLPRRYPSVVILPSLRFLITLVSYDFEDTVGARQLFGQSPRKNRSYYRARLLRCSAKQCTAPIARSNV